MELDVVLIDDEIDLCQMFEDNFSSPTRRIRTFTDSAAGVASIVAERPDVVILDYRMPRTNADATVLAIPEDVPVALLTGDLAVPPNPRFVRVFAKPLNFPEMEEFLAACAATRRP